MNVRPRETVILADDQPRLVGWYQEALGLRVTRSVTDGYHYDWMKTSQLYSDCCSYGGPQHT